MNVGVVTIDFDDVGILHDGHDYGHFTGTAEIDCDETVIALCLEPLENKKPCWNIDVPFPYDENNWVCLLADNIKGRFKQTIKDKLDDWSVSIAEQQFEREAAE